MELESDGAGFEVPAGWEHLSEGEAVRVFGLRASSAEPRKILGLLLSEPSTRPFLRAAPILAGDEDRSLEYLVGGTRIFVRRSELLDLRGDVLAGLAVWVLSQSLTWSAAVGLFHKVSRSVHYLSATEVSVLRTVLELAEGDRPVPVDTIAARWEGERPELERELAALSRHGVLWSEGSGWRVAS